METKVKSWYSTTYRMRAGQTGWIREGTTSVVQGRTKLQVHENMNGEVAKTTKHTLPQIPDEPPAFQTVLDHKGEIKSVIVSVPITLDSQQLEQGKFTNDDNDRAKRIANQALLKQFPGTRFFGDAS